MDTRSFDRCGDGDKILNPTRMEMRIEIINGNGDGKSNTLPKSDPLPCVA